MFVLLFWCLVFFFKQKTAYEMRISDWSSDVCSSDLLVMEDPADLGVGLAGRSPRIGTLEQDAELVTGQDLVPEQCREIPPGARPITLDEFVGKIGRASCRERVCQYV